MSRSPYYYLSRIVDAPNTEHAEAVVQEATDEEFSMLVHEAADMNQETMEGIYVAGIVNAEIARRSAKEEVQP